MGASTRRAHDDLSECGRQYIRAVFRLHRAGGVGPLDVLLLDLVERGVLIVSRVRPGRYGGHPDDYAFRRAPGFTDAQLAAAFAQLRDPLDDTDDDF